MQIAVAAASECTVHTCMPCGSLTRELPFQLQTVQSTASRLTQEVCRPAPGRTVRSYGTHALLFTYTTTHARTSLQLTCICITFPLQLPLMSKTKHPQGLIAQASIAA